MGSDTLGEGKGRVLLQDIMDNFLCAGWMGSPHTMQLLVHKGIYHLHADGRACQQRLFHMDVFMFAMT